ncbi:MAG: hypothetical protein Q7S34_04735 [bacterium]|nr:hypothetical protein [bacterium]
MQRNQGLIGIIIVLIVGILIASYFGISIKNIAESDTAQSNFGYVKQVTINFWNDFLAKPATYLYKNLWLDLIWHPFIDNLQRLKRGQPTTIEPPAINFSQ